MHMGAVAKEEEGEAEEGAKGIGQASSLTIYCQDTRQEEGEEDCRCCKIFYMEHSRAWFDCIVMLHSRLGMLTDMPI